MLPNVRLTATITEVFGSYSGGNSLIRYLIVALLQIQSSCSCKIMSKESGTIQTLNSDESATNGQLGFGRDESRSPCRFLAAAEDAGDAVGFREQGGVDDAETEADGRLLDSADHVRRSQDEQERHHVTEEDPTQQNVTQLPSRRSHNRRVVVPQKHAQHLLVKFISIIPSSHFPFQFN